MERINGNNHSILWADDDADDLYFVREAVRGLPNAPRIVEVGDGRQVIDYLNGVSSPSQLPCLVVLDINMPGVNGKDALATIKAEQRFQNIPVVLFTTSSNETDRRYCERMGAEMITKPFNFSAYKSVVAALISRCFGGPSPLAAG